MATSTIVLRYDILRWHGPRSGWHSRMYLLRIVSIGPKRDDSHCHDKLLSLPAVGIGRGYFCGIFSQSGGF